MRGFSVLEVILSVAIFIIFSSGTIFVVLQGLDSNRLGEEETVANQYAAEGLEAARSIKNQSFSNLAATTSSGLTRNGSNVWALSGLSNAFGKYTRVVSISAVMRDVSGNIVLSGGTLDLNTKKVVSTVSWNVSPTRNNSVVLATYLTDWEAAIASTPTPTPTNTPTPTPTLTSTPTPTPTPAAIAFVDTVSTSGNNTTSGSFTLPAGWQANDVAVFWWYTLTNTKTITPPGTITQQELANSSGFGRIYIGYRVLQSGDTSFAWTSSSASNATVIWGTSVFRNVNTTTPFETDSGAPTTFTNTANPDPPAVTTLSANAVVLPIFGKNNDYSAITVPAGYTTAGSNTSTSGNDASAGVAYFKKASAGSENPGTWSASGTASDDGYVWTGVLKPQ